jgi:TRAP-type C4-dicarboxylate transport system substrate-binding protein
LFTSAKDRIIFSRAIESLQLQLKVKSDKIEWLQEEA